MSEKTIKRKNPRKNRNKDVPGLAGKVIQVAEAVTRNELPNFKAGDTIKVHVKIKEGEKTRLQAFEGVCIKKSNAGENKAFTVRKVSHGVGVERVFMDNSPKVGKVEILQKGKVRRAKLYYLRNLEGKAARVKRDVVAERAMIKEQRQSRE